MKQKGQMVIIFLLILVILGFVGILFYIANQNIEPRSQDSAATSAIPLPLPTFNSMPTNIDEIAKWESYIGERFAVQIKYIEDLLYKILDPKRTSSKQNFSCSANGWEDCMPILTPEAQKQCRKEAIT